jgi:hypothetical protein
MLSVAVTCALAVLLVFTLALEHARGQARWDPNTPKLPMARTWVAYKAKLPPYNPPRTPDGVPDFRGQWGGAGGGGGDDIEEHGYVDVTTPPQESFVSDPADGKIPYTPWALAKRNEIRAGLGRGWPGESGKRLYADPASYCLSTVGPRGGVGEIVQRPGYVIFLGANRVIPTDGRPHINPRAKLWRGNSRGRWEGNTLVIDVTSLNGKHWFDSAGNFYTENTRFVERFTMVDANTIDYELTVEDPTIYTQPWKINFPRRRAGTGGTDNRTGRYAWRDTVQVPQNTDPYARENWENNCNEGVHHTITELHDLGFQWFRGVTPPR